MHEYEQKTYVSAPIWKPAIKAMLPFFFFFGKLGAKVHFCGSFS